MDRPGTGMMSFAGLPDEQVWQLIAYVEVWQKSQCDTKMLVRWTAHERRNTKTNDETRSARRIQWRRFMISGSRGRMTIRTMATLPFMAAKTAKEQGATMWCSGCGTRP